ncbi:uncharacterized protein [Solanum lycopersicum]|uniref:uncharacterized protein n=1 Tax=Solanum lycopersicum TaxID=4081 RepID=UPI003749EACC
MAITTRGGKKTIDPPMLSNKKKVTKNTDKVVEVNGEVEDNTRKDAEVPKKTQIEKRLGVEALNAMIMNFDNDCIEEYESLVATLDHGDVLFKPKKYELNMKNHESPPAKPSIKEDPKLEIKALPPHIRYEGLGNSDTLPVIIASDLNEQQVESLVKVLKMSKRSIGWTIANIIGIPLGICSQKIKPMPDHKPRIEHQRLFNSPMQEVVKKQIIKWLDAGVIYPITDSSLVCHVQCVPKKGGMIMVPNEKNEVVPMRPVIGWRVCMDYFKLNEWTEKHNFPMPFMDQMLDRLAGKGWYYYLDGYSGHN